MRFLEQLKALSHYGRFLSVVGGITELKKALDWANWYAVKWWEEIYRELGFDAVRRSPFARALYLSLKRWGYVRNDGSLARRPPRPGYPANSYVIDFLQLYESLDGLGAVNMATNRVDENTMQMLYSSALSQRWHEMLREAFVEYAEVTRYSTLAEPLVREGRLTLKVLERHRPQLYLAYDHRRDSVELAALMLGAQKDRCDGRGICVYAVPTACDFVKLVEPVVPNGVDELLLFDVIYFMQDPARELKCLYKIVKQGGVAAVGQTVVESAPGLFALAAAFGIKHVMGWKDVENVLSAAGFKLHKRVLKYFPGYVAAWTA